MATIVWDLNRGFRDVAEARGRSGILALQAERLEKLGRSDEAASMYRQVLEVADGYKALESDARRYEERLSEIER